MVRRECVSSYVSLLFNYLAAKPPKPLLLIHPILSLNLTHVNQNDRNGNWHHGRLHARRRCSGPKSRPTVFPCILLPSWFS